MRIQAAIVGMIFVFASATYAGPNTITYQGSVVNTNGTAVADGNYRMRFSLFTVASGGANVWQETDVSVAVTNGLFITMLGDGTAFGALFANNNNLWLEIEIDLNHSGTFDANEKYTPRQKLAGAAWAINTDTLDGVHAASLWRTTGNAGLTSGTHFLGTTDNKPLDFRTSNTRALRLQWAPFCPNVIAGYSGNSVTSGVFGATIGGGGCVFIAIPLPNRVTDMMGTIGGGAWNRAGNDNADSWDSAFGTVSGGFGNTAAGDRSAVGGGDQNSALGPAATVAGGRSSTASVVCATVGGGSGNLAGGAFATVSGGLSNTATGGSATVCGGGDNGAAGSYSFAAGHRAKALHNGTFVWADATESDVSSTAANQFIVRAGGGMMLTPQSGALQPDAQLHVTCHSTPARPQIIVEETQAGGSARLRLVAPILGPTYWDVAASGEEFNVYSSDSGQNILRLLPNNATDLLRMRNGAHLTQGGIWTNGSDRNAKANFAAVDNRQVLEQVAALPIQTWNFRAEPETMRHMGPMAQDFYAAFGLGHSDKSIGTVDADGVALAAIQGLYQVVKEKDAVIAAQQQEIAAQQEQLDKMMRRLSAVESLLTVENGNR